MKRELKRPAVKFTGLQARAVGHGFCAYLAKVDEPVWACSILPEHVHLVVGRSEFSIEYLTIRLKGAATHALIREKLHPFAHLVPAGERPPKFWSRGEWSVFLDSPEDVERCIRYVDNNPMKDGKSPQSWAFVTPYHPTNSACHTA